MTIGSAGEDSVEVSRPTRAQLRQAREREATAEVGVAGEGGPTRAQRREAERRASRRRGPLALLVTAWWFYVALVLVAVCVALAVRSADTPAPRPGVVVTTPTPVQ